MYTAQLIKQFKLFFEGLTKENNTPLTEEDIVEAWELD